MSALRLARAFTERPKIVKFVGCYHGHADLLLVQAGLGRRDARAAGLGRGHAGCRAQTRSPRRTTTSTRYVALFAAHDDIAAVIVEPVAGNMGLVLPEPGFLEGLRDLTAAQRSAARLRRGDDRVPRASRRRAGALRRHAGPDDARQGDRRRAAGRRVRRTARAHGARRAGWAGLPGGNALREPARDDRRESRRCVRSRSRASGTRSSARARGWRRASARSATAFGSRAPGRCSACSSRMCRSRAGTTAKKADTRRFAAFHRAMLERGVYLAPSQFEAGFVSTEHGDAEIDATVAAAADALAAL